MKKFALVGALAALTIASTACGGGGSDTLSEREYINELEDLCTQVNGDLEDLDDPEDYRDLVRLGEDAKDITEQGLSDLQDLKPPKDLENDHEDYVASIERTIDLTDDFIAAAEDEDDDEIAKVGADLEDEDAERNKIAEDIGADDCVTDETTVEEPVDTTEPDEPVDTTEPDEPVETTEPAGTIAPITVPPVEMTMPAETSPPVSGTEIGTFDFDNLTTPAGYAWENVDAESLAGIQDTFGAAYEGQIALIGGAFVTDAANGIEFKAFTFFWNEDDIVASGTGIAFLDGFTSTASSSADTVTTAGFPVTTWTDPDGAEGVGVIDSDVSVVLYGDPGSTQAMLDFFDAFIAAQG
jgi:hypothetical protein